MEFLLSLSLDTTGHSQHLAVQTGPQMDRSASPCLSMGSQKSHLSVPEAKDKIELCDESSHADHRSARCAAPTARQTADIANEHEQRDIYIHRLVYTYIYIYLRKRNLSVQCAALGMLGEGFR